MSRYKRLLITPAEKEIRALRDRLIGPVDLAIFHSLYLPVNRMMWDEFDYRMWIDMKKIFTSL